MMEEIHLPPPATTVLDDFSAGTFPPNDSNRKNTDQGPPKPGVPYGSPDHNKDITTQGRQGHLFCGCLCDMRRAVIAANTISIVIAILELCMLSAFLAFFDEIMNNADDEIMTNSGNGPMAWISMNNYMSKGFARASIVFCVVAIVFFAIGIRGALKFNTCMVTAAMIYHCVRAVASLFTMNIFGMLLSLLFVYPHVMLVMAIKKGTMTEQNYQNEKKTCCS
jgi:hypothetical protein